MSFKKDIGKFTKSLKKAVKEAEKSGNLIGVAGLAIQLIQRRVTAGKGVKKPGGHEYTFARLSPGYVRFRKANKSALSAFTSPGKSNLTFTRQMLTSMVLKKASKSLTITFAGVRVDGKRNEKVAEYVSKKRPFLNLSATEGKKVVSFWSKTFDQLVKRELD